MTKCPGVLSQAVYFSGAPRFHRAETSHSLLLP